MVKAYKNRKAKTTSSSSSLTTTTTATAAAAAAAASESERLQKSVQFILPEATPENDSEGVWEMKKGKKASETAEQRAKRLQRQKDAKLAKKLALEQEAHDKKAAEERAMQERYQTELEERAAKDAAHIAQIAESQAAAEERRRLEVEAEAKIERDMIERVKLESLEQEQQRALFARQRDEEMRAAFAASLVASQAPPTTLPQSYTAGAADLYLSANGGMSALQVPVPLPMPVPLPLPLPLPQLVSTAMPVPLPAPARQSHVDSSIADLQLNIFKLKQALQIPQEPVEFHTYSGGTLTKVVGPPPMQAHGVPATLSGFTGLGTGPSPVVGGMLLGGATGLAQLTIPGGDPRPMVTMVGGELLDWLVPFHTKFEFVSRLPSPRLTAASGAETPDILIYQFEFPAGMGTAVAGLNEDKLPVLQRSSGCVLTVNYSEDTRGWAKDDEVLRAGTLRITGTINTLPNFVKLFDAQMLGAVEYLQSRKFVPKGAATAAPAAPVAPTARPVARAVHGNDKPDGGDNNRQRGPTAHPKNKPRDGAQKGGHAQRAQNGGEDDDADNHADDAGAYQAFFEVPEVRVLRDASRW